MTRRYPTEQYAETERGHRRREEFGNPYEERERFEEYGTRGRYDRGDPGSSMYEEDESRARREGWGQGRGQHWQEPYRQGEPRRYGYGDDDYGARGGFGRRELYGPSRAREWESERGYEGASWRSPRGSWSEEGPGHRGGWPETRSWEGGQGWQGGTHGYRGSRGTHRGFHPERYQGFQSSPHWPGSGAFGSYGPGGTEFGGYEGGGSIGGSFGGIHGGFATGRYGGSESWTETESRQFGRHRGRGPKAYKRSDQRITEDINDRLTDDDDLDASGIEVKVDSGEVTLTGTVPDRRSKRLAEDIAESVSGVQNVQNNLRVQRETHETGTRQTSSYAGAGTSGASTGTYGRQETGKSESAKGSRS